MEISYKEVRGRIEVVYRLDHAEYSTFPHASDVPEEPVWLDERSVGLVPRVVRRQGKKAIMVWAQVRCKAELKQLRTEVMARYRVQEERQYKIDRPLSVVSAEGTAIQAQVRYVSRFSLRLDILTPFALPGVENISSHERFAFGTPLFAWDGTFTEKGLALAEEWLGRLYAQEVRRRAHGSALRLVAALNKH